MSSIWNEKHVERPSEIFNLYSSQSGSINQALSTQLFEQIQPPNIQHEVDVAKSIMQQGSFITGDNLFDHLADIIKLYIKEQPTNIGEYFEELSFNMRQQKFRMPENFPWAYFEPIDVERARSFLKLMNIPYEPNDKVYDVCRETDPKLSKMSKKAILPTESLQLQRKLSMNENIQRLNLFWALCGFGLSNDEVCKLSYALHKVQCHKIVQHARFWGKIYGLQKSYYIVEAQLTQSEIDIRFDKMKEEMMDKIHDFRERKRQAVVKEEDPNLIPGTQWQNYSEQELEKMKPTCEPIPKSNSEQNVIFDMPPEAIGTGLNRRSYFVVNSLDDEWVELPIVYPQQIQVSRKIKKFLTGELDADIVSYPDFPGTEKHYLRAIIARITSGTYVAPNDYYRRLTKNELKEVNGETMRETENENEESDGEEEEELDNDAIIIENENYKPCEQKLTFLKSWVHVRPNILEQGRIVYFDEKEALEALEKESLLTIKSERGFKETDIEEEVDIFEGDESTIEESGPALFSPCNADVNKENVKNWSVRYSSTRNIINQLTILRSNLWPGAHSFTFNKYSDSIYFGWGFKYTARNISREQIPVIQTENYTYGLDEVSDPTVEMEKAWLRYITKKEIEEMPEDMPEDMQEEQLEEEESC